MKALGCWLRRLASRRSLVGMVIAARAGLAPAGDLECPPEPDLAAAASPHAARDRGFLWRLSRDGRDSWLFGTLHVGRPEWTTPGPRLREALRASDAVALELDPLDPESARGFARAVEGLRQAGATLGEDQRRRLARLAERACAATAGLASQHPLLQIMQLTVLEARRQRLDVAFAQENVLGAAARALKRPVHSLETPAQQVAALLPPDGDLHREVERALRQFEEGHVQPVLRQLADVWEQGDIEKLQDYARWCECQLDDADRAAFVRLNDARNPLLAERIAMLHGSQRLRVFAAVGALHMTGPLALQRLLAERHGFAVERVVLSR